MERVEVQNGLLILNRSYSEIMQLHFVHTYSNTDPFLLLTTCINQMKTIKK